MPMFLHDLVTIGLYLKGSQTIKSGSLMLDVGCELFIFTQNQMKTVLKAQFLDTNAIQKPDF